MRAPIITLAVALFAMPLAVVEAQDDSIISAEERERDARALFSMASRHYETGRLEESIQEFERAYALYPVPAFQYNLYLANRDAGNLDGAATALRLYLDSETEMDAERRASLERRHQLLAASVERNGAAAPTENTSPESVDTSEPDDSTPAVEPVADEPNVTPASSEGGLSPVIGGVTLGVAGALLVGALIEGLVANGKKSDLDEVCNDAGCLAVEQGEIVSSFETHRNVSWGLLYSGIGVAATGVILLLLSGDDEPDSSAGLSCDETGCRGTYEHRF